MAMLKTSVAVALVACAHAFAPATSATEPAYAPAGSPVSVAPLPAGTCPLPVYLEDGTYGCQDQSLTLEQRRQLLPPPYDMINGRRLEDIQPASGATTLPITDRASTNSYSYLGVDYAAFNITRTTGYRAPIHYHEQPQMLCLTSGRITVVTEGEEDKDYEAPDCYMMPAFTKVSVLTRDTKVEVGQMRVPKGGYNWIVLEPEYYDLQGQWAGGETF